MQRREFFRRALALPLTGILAPFERLAAADVGKVKITDIKMRPSASHTQVRVDTDAGISGIGESGVTASTVATAAALTRFSSRSATQGSWSASCA